MKKICKNCKWWEEFLNFITKDSMGNCNKKPSMIYRSYLNGNFGCIYFQLKKPLTKAK
jgi:hypothetical protein